MVALRDRTSERYGMLVVLARQPDLVLPSGRRKAKWLCRCDCGDEIEVIGDNLQSGNTSSCWCKRREQASLNRISHGETICGDTPEYRAWIGAIHRCHSPGSKDYPRYGARGIQVCDRWRNDFAAFVSDMGRKPSPRHSLDRIDVNGPYAPNNCRWATAKEQGRNRRTNRLVSFQGRRMTIAEASEASGLSDGLIRNRKARGWADGRIFS